MDELSPNRKDRLVSIAKVTAATIPYFGGLISEILTETIPDLRFDRAITFIRCLDEEFKKVEARVEDIERRLQSEEGIDLLEEGILQASRSVTSERKLRLARLIARSLGVEELKYEQSKTLLNLYKELTDPEIVWLIYYSMKPSIDAGAHNQWKEQHPEVLEPISREMGASQEQQERVAMQDLWKDNLTRFGLIRHRGRGMVITTLGKMLVDRIQEYE